MNRLPASNRLSRLARVAGQRGVGLIEVLVSVLILAIGLLGVAMVQTRGLSSNNSSMARSMAVMASYSILDVMRADRTNAIGGNYNKTLTGDSCTVSTTTFAQSQLISWCQNLALNLGNTSTTIGTVACDTSGVCTITIQFDDSRVGAGSSAAQQVVTKAML